MPVSLWPEAAPLALVWCCYLYMPIVVYLYSKHAGHPLIKYRQPHLITPLGCLLTVYCLGGPILLVWNDSSPALVYVFVCNFVPSLAMATLLMSAMVVVLHHKITELLVAPTQFPRDLIPTLTRYRWLLDATNQRTSIAALGCLLILPHAIPMAASGNIARMTTSTFYASRLFNVLLFVFFIELLVAATIAFRLSKQLAPIVDTFHQRQTYRWSFGCAGLFVAFSFLLAIGERFLHIDRLGADYYCRNVLNTLAAQSVMFFNLVLPVYHVCTYSIPLTSFITTLLLVQTTTRVTMVATSEMPSHLMELNDYLRERDHYAAFLAFCLISRSGDCATEVLLAWRCIETFKTCRGTASTAAHGSTSGPNGALVAAEQVVVMCFGPGAPLASSALRAQFGSIYMDRWAMWKTIDPANAPPADFFDEFHQALLGDLATNVLPQFQAQSQSWSIYITYIRSLRGLEKVQQMGSIPLAWSQHLHVVQGHIHVEGSNASIQGIPLGSQPNDATIDEGLRPPTDTSKQV
ncbi:Aste57867_1276 [Aphanomyces stellatus]|uniref:Aste57867_1276 protein n=1 Tax=Aphanomyces stellatus TaxID=120398 RepID=A0A485K859_9STRA|nr:hypothetical protein As57867_001275 [Aphanomyces stellatus]VFT78495.1 Aste57867_1276 [Aphanomyces stellatus]